MLDPLCIPRNVLMFLAALVTTCVGLHSVLPLPEIPQVSAALEQWRAVNAEYDTIFVGSSRVRRQISPAVFDQRMAERGRPTRSLNLGVDAMTFPELAAYLERILAERPPRLRNIFIDLNPARLNFDAHVPFDSARATWWHSYNATVRVCRQIMRQESLGSMAERRWLCAQHVWVMLRNYGNLGAGVRWLRQAADVEEESRGPQSDGFVPVDDVLPPVEAERYSKRLAEMRALDSRPYRDDPITTQAYNELLKELWFMRTRAFFIAMPVIAKTRPRPPGAAPIFANSKTQAATFEFNDPFVDEVLYDPAHRYDIQHLNLRGSEEFSRRLADRFADHLYATKELRP